MGACYSSGLTTRELQSFGDELDTGDVIFLQEGEGEALSPREHGGVPRRVPFGCLQPSALGVQFQGAR